MKNKTLLTLLGIIMLSLNPKEVKDMNPCFQKEKNDILMIDPAKKDTVNYNDKEEGYKKEIKIIKNRITLLNSRKEYYSRRLNETGLSSIESEEYRKDSVKTENEIKNFERKLDSLYRLIGN